MIPYGNVAQLYVMKATLSPAEVAAATSAEQTFTVPGLKLGRDMVMGVSKPTTNAGLGIVGARVSADNTLALTIMNATAGALTATASQVYMIAIARIDGGTAEAESYLA
jgi:hypothetical protein